MKPSAIARAELSAIAALAVSLEKFDHSAVAIDAGQYRLLVARLSERLLAAAGQSGLSELLARFPSAAELYENLRYEHAGLCLHDLDRSLRAEQLAATWIRQAAGR